MGTEKKYLDEEGVKQLLDYLELQHKKFDLLTPEYIQEVVKQVFNDSTSENVILYGGSATDQINDGLIVYDESASTGGTGE